MTRNKPLLSIIVPVFNEQKRLYHLAEICDYFAKVLPTNYEVLVVNDGSFDNTESQLISLSKKYPVSIVSYPFNRGKGFAVRLGMLRAAGQYRLFMDIDLSTHPSEWVKAQKLLNQSDIIIGVRRSQESQVLIHQSLLREKMGQVYTWLSQTILNTPVNDFTCGFKIFSEKSALEIFSRSRIDRWGFDSEILYLGHSLNFKISQIPVVWKNDSNTRVSIYRDAIGSLIELITIRLYSWYGKYSNGRNI